jgi:hypothetical protein
MCVCNCCGDFSGDMRGGAEPVRIITSVTTPPVPKLDDRGNAAAFLLNDVDDDVDVVFVDIVDADGTW